MALDLEQHLLRQMAFSRATFGPGACKKGVCDHIRKELVEVEDCVDNVAAADEWVDVVILALDGLTRALTASGWTPDQVATEAVLRIKRKQTRNELRRWPDWRTANPNTAIEHDRSGES